MGSIIYENVVYHEAGHILAARALHWRIDKIIKDSNNSVLSTSYLKQLKDRTIRSYFPTPQTDSELLTNWERVIISQGGYVAEKYKGYEVKGQAQFKQDDLNASMILNTLPGYQLKGAKKICYDLISENVEILEEITFGIQEFLRDKKYDFNQNFNYQHIPEYWP